jgi:antitoxin (DNA-binding transcriptional repressor) of toxin-antitoxin stability system
VSTTLTIQEAQSQLKRLLELAHQGHEVIIDDAGKRRAKLIPIVERSLKRPRVFGLHEGQAWTSDDFDAPLPDSFWLGEDR